MMAPIFNRDDLIARRSIIRRIAPQYAGFLRTFNVPKPRQQLESRSNEHGSQRENNS
jgi:hypothetical protein